GVAPGEKVQGGILNHVLKELEVECLPEDIPQKIEVSISELELGQAIHVSDLPLPDKLTAITPSTTAIVTVYKEKDEKAEAAEAGEGEAEGSVAEAAPEKGPAASGEGDAGKKGG
ncbi:MAG: 50S ribosomal protein L25, partial [Nitrospinales bacterium]